MRRLIVGLAIGFATLTPTWALANDQQIAQTIIQKLEQQKQAGQLSGFGIDLQVDNGTVFMNGRVTSPEQQQIALGIAQRTAGVKEVVNGLKITEAPAAKPVMAPAEAKQGGMFANLGSSMKKALGGDNVQQVSNVEPINAPKTSVLKKSTAKPAPSYTAEMGSGVTGQTRLVSAQEPPTPGYLAPAPQPQMGVNPAYHQAARAQQMPYPFAQTSGYHAGQVGPVGGPVPSMPSGMGVAPARYDHPNMPGYAWPSYAAHPNYAAVTYPKQYSPTAWPYIGPFYPYPQVPLGWRKVTLEWDDGWWMLDFKDQSRHWKPHR